MISALQKQINRKGQPCSRTSSCTALSQAGRLPLSRWKNTCKQAVLSNVVPVRKNRWAGLSPRGQANGPLLEAVAGQWISKLKVETRALPASVVNRKAEERVAQIEASTGRKPGKKETRDLKDDIRLELMPMAFTKQASVSIWLDREAQLLVIDAASQTRADEVVTLLVQALPGFAARLINTKVSPVAAMAEWLVSQEAPAGFSVDRECELKAVDESKAVVRYARHRLDMEEVKQHIAEGKMPTRLAMTWDDRGVLHADRGLATEKAGFSGRGVRGCEQTKDDNFDADVAIATGELQKLLPDVLEHWAVKCQ